MSLGKDILFESGALYKTTCAFSFTFFLGDEENWFPVKRNEILLYVKGEHSGKTLSGGVRSFRSEFIYNGIKIYSYLRRLDQASHLEKVKIIY